MCLLGQNEERIFSFNLYEPFGGGEGAAVANGGSTVTNGSVPNGVAHSDHSTEGVASASADAPAKPRSAT